MRICSLKKTITLAAGLLFACRAFVFAAEEWGGDGDDYRAATIELIATADRQAAELNDEWGGDGDDYRFATDLANLTNSRADGLFQQMFGPDFKITGGSLRYAPDRQAVIIRDYATVLIQNRRISARNLVFFTNLSRLYAEGDVTLEEKSGSFLLCDQLYFDLRDGRGRARNVRLRSTDQSVSASPITEVDAVHDPLNIDTQKNSFSLGLGTSETEQDATRSVRMNIYATDLRVVSENHYEATQTWASPSNFAEPHWRITSKAVNIRAGEKVEAWHNLFKIGKVPVFYLPYLIYDLHYNWPYYRPALGSDDKQGFYFLNRLGWKFHNPTDGDGRAVDEYGDLVKRYFQLDRIFFDADLRTGRGWGFGAETDYAVDWFGKGSGNFKAYHTRESYTMFKEDQRRATEDVEFRSDYWSSYKNFTPAYYGNADRYLIEWQHQHRLDDKLDLRTQLHRFGDRDFYKEYFPSEWAKNEQKLTNADFRYLDNAFAADLAVQMRINDYRTETEYLPRLTFDVPGYQLIDNFPLYLESNTELAFVRRRQDQMLEQLNLLTPRDRTRQNGDTPWVGRAYQNAMLSLPIDLNFLTIRPWGGGFLAGYTDGYKPEIMDSHQGAFNTAAKWGVDFSSRFFGDWNNRWTHIIEPQVSLINYESPVTNRDRLYEFDAVDNYRQSRMLTLNLHQDLMKTQTDGGERRFASANIRTGLILDDNEAVSYNANRMLADIAVDGSLYPTETWSLWGNASYSPAASALTNATVGTDFWINKQLRLFAQHAYDAGYDYTNYQLRYAHTQTTTWGVRLQLWDRFSHYAVEYGMSYQWDDTQAQVMGTNHYLTSGAGNGFQKQRISLIRDLDTFDAAVTYAHDFTSGNWTVYATLTPKNWLSVNRVPDSTTAVTLDQDWHRYSHPVPERMNKYSYDTSTPAWQ